MVSRDITRWISLVAYPELTLLDLVGPLQVLRGLDAPFRTAVVAERLEPILTDTGLRITPEATFADIPRPDVIVIPGGPGSVAAMANQALQTYLRSAAGSRHCGCVGMHWCPAASRNGSARRTARVGALGLRARTVH